MDYVDYVDNVGMARQPKAARKDNEFAIARVAELQLRCAGLATRFETLRNQMVARKFTGGLKVDGGKMAAGGLTYSENLITALEKEWRDEERRIAIGLLDIPKETPDEERPPKKRK